MVDVRNFYRKEKGGGSIDRLSKVALSFRKKISELLI